MAAAGSCREQSIEKAKELILERLYSVNHGQTTATALQSRTEALGVVRTTLEQSIHRAFSSSLIIQGPSGSGKSWLINEVLKSLHSDPKSKDLFLVVRLNGLVHMDDHQALLEIVTQLGLEVEPGKMIQMSFVNALKLLMETLGQGHRGQKSVVFVIEAFEAFVSHKNQTLLYNLLDLAQTDHTPIAVVGLTSLLNTTDRLEKRIRSRASFQVVYLDLDFSFEEYLGICKSLLSLPSHFADKAFLRKWKVHLEGLIKDSDVQSSLRDMYNISANLHWLRLSLAMAVSQSHLLVEPGDLKESIQHMIGGYSVSPMLTGLSVLEMTLLVAVHHLVTLSEHDHFNFEMVYSEYKRFIQRSQSARFCDKNVVLKAFEHLVQLEIVHPATGISHGHSAGGRRTTKEHKMMASGVAPQELKEAIRNFPNCPTDLSRWALSQSMKS